MITMENSFQTDYMDQNDQGLLMPSTPVPSIPPPPPPSGPITSLSTSLPQSTCCENGRPLITDPYTGQSVCSCQYGSGLLGAYNRVPSVGDNMYSSPHYATQGYMPLNTDTSAFYSPLNPAHYDTLKDSTAAEAWRGITQPTACYPYDPAMTAYPYPNTYGGMDLNGAARRKNATRETTNTLKAWLYEHRKNPYPTKGEKIMLAIITKMTLTQVSTWFANARRRLKKENKMTWSPRNRCGDDDDDKCDDDDDDDVKSKDCENGKSNNENPDKDCDKDRNEPIFNNPLKDLKTAKGPFTSLPEDRLCLDKLDTGLSLTPPPLKPQATLVPDINLGNDLKRLGSPCSNSSDSGLSDINGSMSTNGSAASDHNDPLRPRIWSLAHVATSTSGGTAGLMSLGMELKDQNANLTQLKPGPNTMSPMSSISMGSPNYSSTSNSMRPWFDSTFNVGSSLFSPMSGTYSSLGTQRPRESPSNMVNQSLNSLQGLSSPPLARGYPSLSSLYAPARDFSKPRSIDTMSELRS